MLEDFILGPGMLPLEGLLQFLGLFLENRMFLRGVAKTANLNDSCIRQKSEDSSAFLYCT